MANIYQQAAKQRMWIYLGSMFVLLVLSLVVRGTFFRIDKKSLEEVSTSGVMSLTMDGRAKTHELTELQQGDTELGGAAIQLLLTGSRGLAVCALWNNAIDKQKKQEWNELDISVNSITKLQPHFTAPWLFQSWNLAYNVSVEMDRLNDMYFYIARGISVIAEGEALNRNNPDLRYNVGFYYQNKFGVSDKVTTLRCLYQLSCIPEEDRNPDNLMTFTSDGQKVVNLAAFEKFCEEHPQLVRRMKETRIPVDGSEERARPLATSPEGVLAFLRNNRKVPTRYKPGTKELNDRLKQFPVLPELAGQPVATREVDYKAPLADHEQDAFVAARAWYTLANCALPPPTNRPVKDGTYNPDPLKYRIPKRPATIIFRQGPMRAQTYHAERLTKEGWFTAEPWEVDDLIDRDRAWIPKTGPDGQRVSAQVRTIGSAQEAWKEAFRRWNEHGIANGLRITPAKLAEYFYLAQDFCRIRPGLMVGSPTPPLTPEEEQNSDIVAAHEAHQIMHGWSTNRYMTNFETFELEADGMRTDDAMQALSFFRKADKAVREASNYAEAVGLFEKGFAAWKRLLVAKQDCRAARASDPTMAGHPCRDFRDLDRYQEDMYEQNLRYTKLSQDVHKNTLRGAMVAVQDLLRYAGGSSTGNMLFGTGDLGVWYALAPQLRTVPPIALPGPLDGNAPDGTPWVPDDVKLRVRQKLGLVKAAPQLPPDAPGAGPPRPIPTPKFPGSPGARDN
jgi:hypothetical protein